MRTLDDSLLISYGLPTMVQGPPPPVPEGATRHPLTGSGAWQPPRLNTAALLDLDMALRQTAHGLEMAQAALHRLLRLEPKVRP